MDVKRFRALGLRTSRFWTPGLFVVKISGARSLDAKTLDSKTLDVKIPGARSLDVKISDARSLSQDFGRQISWTSSSWAPGL